MAGPSAGSHPRPAGHPADVAPHEAEVDRLDKAFIRAHLAGDKEGAARLQQELRAASARLKGAKAAAFGERVAAWKDGDAKVRAVADLEDIIRPVRREVRHREFKVRAAQEDVTALANAGQPTADAMVRQAGAEFEARQARAALERAIRAQDARIREIVGVPETDRHAWDHKINSKSAAVKSLHEAAREYLEPLVARGQAAEPGKIAWKGLRAGERPFYDGDKRSIHLNGEIEPSVAVHEWGHAIEYQVPGVREAVQAFREYRLQGEAPRPLVEVIPGSSYEPDETGAKDRFDEHFGPEDAWYVGKGYHDGSTEILSMGLEALHRDPTAFARDDPEYFKLVVGILNGELRGP